MTTTEPATTVAVTAKIGRLERVLNDERMSPEAMAAVREAYESVRRGHDEASELKHRLEAAD